MCFKQGYEQFHAVDSRMIFFICLENFDFVLSEAMNTRFVIIVALNFSF